MGLFSVKTLLQLLFQLKIKLYELEAEIYNLKSKLYLGFFSVKRLLHPSLALGATGGVTPDIQKYTL